VKLRQIHRRRTTDSVTKIHREKVAMGQKGMIHINKTPESILDFLREENIVMDNCDGPWLNIKTSDAEVYMSILAKYLARIEGNVDIGTDISSKFFKPHIRSDRKSIEKQLYLNMAMQAILPEPNLEDVSIQDIIDFKMKYAYELQRFRIRMNSFYDALKMNSTDISEIINRTKELCNEIQLDLQIIENQLKKEQMPFRHVSLRSLIPLGITACITIAVETELLTVMQGLGIDTILNLILLGGLDSTNQSDNKITDGNSYLFYAKKNKIIK